MPKIEDLIKAMAGGNDNYGIFPDDNTTDMMPMLDMLMAISGTGMPLDPSTGAMPIIDNMGRAKKPQAWMGIGQGGTSEIGTKAKVAPADIYDYLVNTKGLSHNKAMGILPNIQAESGFNPGIKEKGVSKGGVGLFQHTGPRREGLYNAHGVRDASQIPWQKQVDYALSEPEGQQYLNRTYQSPAEATGRFLNVFEKPKIRNINERLKYLRGLEKVVQR